MKLSRDEVNVLWRQTLSYAKRFSNIAASMGECPLSCDRCLHEDAVRMNDLIAQLEHNLQSRSLQRLQRHRLQRLQQENQQQLNKGLVENNGTV